MDVERNLREVSRLHRSSRETAKQQYNERSSERLGRSLDKKFKTTFIGALSAFEEAFGDLWGHGLPEDELTNEQFFKRELWDKVRTNVLNNGNNQLRATQAELAEYTVEWNRHQTNMRTGK